VRFAVVAVAAVALCCGAALAAGALREGTPPSAALKGTWTSEGILEEVARVGPTLFVGGLFKRMTRVSGHSVAYDRSTGATLAPWPAIENDVRAAVSDGRGGFFLGGNVGSANVGFLVHVEPDGTVDPGFQPGYIDGWVDKLAFAGGRLYVGGGFTVFDGASCVHLAALNATTGARLHWGCHADADVAALVASGNRIVAALNDDGSGQVVEYGARGERRWAAPAGLDPCQEDADNARKQGENPNVGAVDSLALDGKTVYVGGYFTSLGGAPRKVAAALDLRTGAVRSWNQRVTGGPCGGVGDVSAIAAGPTRVFFSVNAAHGTLVAADKRTGKASSPRILSWSCPCVLARAANRLYFDGLSGVVALDARTGKRVQWPAAPPAGDIATIAVGGRKVVVGGDFDGVGGAVGDGLVAIDASTGEPTAWDPPARWSEVDGLAADNGTLYVSGLSEDGPHTAGGLNEATGKALPWTVPLDDDQGVCSAANGLVFLCSWTRLEALDEATGARRWTAPISAGGIVHGASVAGGKVYVAGRFTSIEGTPRPGLAALDAATGTITPWQPTGQQWSADQQWSDVAATSTRVYAVDDQSNLIAAFDPSTGARIWQVATGADGGPTMIAVSPGAVIVGGGFTAVAGKPHVGLVALDPQTGAPLPWKPAIAPGTQSGFVYAIAASGRAVDVVGSFTIDGNPDVNLVLYG
jgi:outer membrane protein assembly factor BamB